MDVIWILLALAIWLVVGLVVAVIIGRAVRRGDEDSRLFGSLVQASRSRRRTNSSDDPQRHEANPQADDTSVS